MFSPAATVSGPDPGKACVYQVAQRPCYDKHEGIPGTPKHVRVRVWARPVIHIHFFWLTAVPLRTARAVAADLDSLLMR